MKIDKIQLEITIKADSARVEMKKLDDEAKLIQKSMKGLKKDSEEYIRKNEELSKVKDKWKELNDSIGFNQRTMAELQKEAKSLRVMLLNATPGSEKFDEYRSRLDTVNSRMKELRTGADKTSKGFDAFTNKLTSIPGPAGQAINAIKGFGVALKALLLNPVGLTIAAIVAALMLLYKAFMSTDSGATAFAGVMKGLSNVIDVVIDRTVSLFKSLYSLMTLDYKGFKENAKDAFGGIATSIKDAALAGYEYEQVMDSIADRESASLIRSANLKTEIERLKNAAKDSNLPIEERIKLNDLAMKKSEELLKIEKGFLKEKNQAELNNLAAMLQVQGMSIDQKRKQINEWLKLDDRSIEEYKKKSARFADFIDKNEKAFQNLQKLKSEEILKDAEFEQQTRRLQSEGFTFQKTLQQEKEAKSKEAAENRKKQQEEAERKALATIDAWKNKEELLIKEKYSLGQLSKEKYESELLRIEKESLTKKRDLYKKDTKDYIDYQTNLTDIAIAERLKSNEAELKVLETANTARVKAIDVYAQTRKEELEQLFADELITEKEYKEKSLIIDIETANAKLQNAKDYFVLISDAKYNSEEEKQRAILSAQNAVDAANKAVLDAQKAANKNKLDEEKKHLEYVNRLRNELGLNKEKLNYKEGLDALKKKLKEAEASEKESADAINAYKIGKAQEYAQTTNDIAGSVADAISAYHEYEVASLDAAKQKELKSAGDNASKREAIEKDYAQKELDLKKKQSSTDTVIKSLQAVAAGALGIANVWAVHAANPILAGILTALVAATTGIQVGTIVKQNQAIQAMTLDTSTGGSPATPEPKGTLVAQAADGRYDVVGAQDNQLYRNVPYGGNARTGLVTTPTLYGERGTELVIDAPTLSRLNMKVPNFNSFVLANRVNQRADGNYAPAQSGAASAGSNTVMLTMIATLQKNNELLDYLKTHGVEAFMLYDKAQQQQRIYEESIKKGSK